MDFVFNSNSKTESQINRSILQDEVLSSLIFEAVNYISLIEY